jgi:branched-chain amino acid transport system substrate-binding protein
MTRFFWWIFSLSLALASPALAFDPVVIGVCLPLSGNLGTTGHLMWDGIKAAHRIRPEVLDRRVELRATDTRSQKAEATDALFRLIERDNVTAVIGDVKAWSARVASTQADKRGIPMVVPSPLGLLVTCGNRRVFEVCSSYRSEAGIAASFALSRPDCRTAAIIYDMSDECSVGLAAQFRRQFTGADKRVLFQARIKTGDRDFIAQINEIRKAKPDVIYAPIPHLECALLARQARDMGVDATLIVGAAIGMPDLMSIGGRSVEDPFLTAHFDEGMLCTDTGKRFPDLCPLETGCPERAARAMGADAYLLILDAIARGGSAEPGKIQEALCSSTSFDVVTRKTAAETGVQAAKPIVRRRPEEGGFVEFWAGWKIVRASFTGTSTQAVISPSTSRVCR